MAYLYIFAGSYILFFVTSWLYILIIRYNTVSVYRQNGWSEEKIRQHLATDEWRGRSMANRSTIINGSLFGVLVGLVYTLTIVVLGR